ncbi:MAG: fimbria/pilus outer membrane usher protein [Gammaproteobacteria bacterium]
MGVLLGGIALSLSGVQSTAVSAPTRDAPGFKLRKVSAQETQGYSQVWLSVRINGAETGAPKRLLISADGRLLATATDFQDWRIAPPAVPAAFFRGIEYFALDAVPGLSYQLDERTQELNIEGSPDIFAATVLGVPSQRFALPGEIDLGGFLNYDLQFQHQRRTATWTGLIELGLFHRLGVGTATTLARDIGDQNSFTRLETTWTADDPERLSTLRLGDAIGRPGAWGGSVRFGGIQWGTNFATQPEFITFPLPTLSGEARIPSTVELFANSALRLQQSVPPGPFEIPNVPLITGAGDVQLVVRDLLGRQRVLVVPYYVSQALLRAGLTDYTFDLGFERENFGIESNDYGRGFGAATYRAGVTDRLTAEARAEVLKDQQALGFSASYLWPIIGVANAALVASSSDAGGGGLFALGLDRQARRVSYGVQSQWTTPHFAQLGRVQGELRQTTLARVSVSPDGSDTFSLSYLLQDNRSQPRVEFVSVGYDRNIFRDYHLSVFALQSLTGVRDTSFGITLTLAFGERSNASVNWTQQNADHQSAFQIQRNLPEGTGLGYRLLGLEGTDSRAEAGVFYQNDIGTFGAETSQFGDADAYRLSASGGLAALGNEAFLARRISESFAVVRVGNYPNVGIYAENQPVARTNSRGTALVPRVRAYEKNNIGIEQADLPLDARFAALRMDVTPAFRSGVLADFGVRPANAALLTIVLSDRSPLPAGAIVRVVGGKEQFPVALRGEVYVTELARFNRLEARWRGQRCRFEVRLPKAAGPLPRLGPFECRGVVP